MHTSSPSSCASPSRRHALWATVAVAAAAAALATGCAVKVPAQVQPVTNFEVTKYMGQWYEIARIDQRFQTGLTKATAVYTLNGDGTVRVVNRGFNAAKNEWKEVVGTAKFLGQPTVGALKVSFFGPFYGGYNVIDIGPNYTTALVAGNTPDDFWLLSRTRELPAEQIQALLRKAAAQGVNVDKVIFAQ